jgi:hypothetical protein
VAGDLHDPRIAGVNAELGYKPTDRRVRGRSSSPVPAQEPRAASWVSPASRPKELFDQLHEMSDAEEAVHVSAEQDVEFLPVLKP